MARQTGKCSLAFPPLLTAAEQSFLEHEVEALCRLIDDWDIQQRHDLSPQTWRYLREHGFFGLIIPEEYGGKISVHTPRAG